jgi:fatty-acyl-CoA synthase
MKRLSGITLGEVLRGRAATCGDKEFIVYPSHGLRYTFGEIDKKADALAKGLLAAGFKKGDHIGIWANNVPDWPFVFYAASRIGVVVVPVNSNYRRNELEYILIHADLKGLFIIDKYREVDYVEILYHVIPELRNHDIGGLQSDKFPFLKIIINMDKTSHEGICLMEDLIRMGDWIDNGELKKAESEVDSADTICIMYTSGTTGIPKGVMLTHKNVINTNYNMNRLWLLNENDVILNPLPFFHVFALTGCIIESVVHGFKFVVLENFDARICLEVIQEEKCSWIYGVPTMYMAILNHPDFNAYNIKTVAFCCISAAVCPPDLMKTVLAKMCTKGLYLAYGLTEAIPLTDVVIEDSSDPRIATVGVPLSGIEICIRNTKNTDCPINVTGEICARGFNVMKGYYKMEEATKETIDENGWLHTGDLGHLLPGGCLVIDGRIKELIIWGGENIYPKEVENLLLAMPGIQDVQVIGIPSEKYGEEVGAFIILKPGKLMSEKDIMDYCKGRISFYKIPKYIFFTDSFPLSPVGKVQKFKLSELGLKKVREMNVVT